LIESNSGLTNIQQKVTYPFHDSSMTAELSTSFYT
jgi:hypothetical protein